MREIAIVNRDGSVNIVPYQYNAVFRKPMEVLTIEQRNALATKLREQRDMERIISSMPETADGWTQYPQAPKQSAEQTAETADRDKHPQPCRSRTSRGRPPKRPGRDKLPHLTFSAQAKPRKAKPRCRARHPRKVRNSREPGRNHRVRR